MDQTWITVGEPSISIKLGEKQSERIHLSPEEIELDRIKDVDRVVQLLRNEKHDQERKVTMHRRSTHPKTLIKPTFTKPTVNRH